MKGERTSRMIEPAALLTLAGVETMTKIHFLSGDERFCGSTEAPRRVSPDPNEITCQDCMNRDTLTLTEQGRQTLRDLGYDVPAA